jgi:hypothetical protein
MNAVIKIEATGTRLFLVVVVFGVAFGAASLLEHLLRVVPIDIQPNGGPTESWPPWLLTWQAPIVLRDRDSYSYIVLPQPDSSSSESKATIRTGSRRILSTTKQWFMRRSGTALARAPSAGLDKIHDRLV